jgi:hypothetical protein
MPRNVRRCRAHLQEGERWVCKACGWVHFGRGLICNNCKSDNSKPADNVAYIVSGFGDMVKQWSNYKDRGVKTGANAPMTNSDGTPWG